MDKQFLVRWMNKFLWLADVLILICVFIFVNISAFGGAQFPNVSSLDDPIWRLLPALGLIVIFMIVSLFARGLLGEFWRTFYKNYWLIMFLLFSLISILWSVYFPATLYELSLLFFSSLAAAYFSIRYRISGSISLLTGVAAVCIFISYSFVFFTSGGIMQNPPFTGSWCGLFWHRNHTGSLMAFFSMIFLTRSLMEENLSGVVRLFFATLYLLAVWHVFGSRSAAGILIFITLNAGVAIFYYWVKRRDQLVSKHYYAFFTIAVIGFVVFVTNLEFFFGLLGRTAQMTGRTPLWNDLLLNFYSAKPWVGYGFGALWMQENFRLLMQSRHGWLYPVYFADNGFLDILLNLGVVGLVLFLGILVAAFRRSIRALRRNGSWEDILLFLILCYVVLANLAYSFLFEVDYFVWMIFLVFSFLVKAMENRLPEGGYIPDIPGKQDEQTPSIEPPQNNKA